MTIVTDFSEIYARCTFKSGDYDLKHAEKQYILCQREVS